MKARCGKGRPPPYFNLIKKHLTELHTKYPGLRVQVLDCWQRLTPAQLEALTQLIHQLNPKCVILSNFNLPLSSKAGCGRRKPR